MKNLFILVMLSLLSACDTNHDKDLPPGTIKNIGIYKPEVNKHPKYWATFNGFIDPKLENKVPLRIFAVYESNNTKCQYIRNRLDGILVDRIELRKTTINPDRDGRFTYKIPLDLFKPGYCNWDISNIRIQDNNVFALYDPTVMVRFDKSTNNQNVQTPTIYNLSCDVKGLSNNSRPCNWFFDLNETKLSTNRNHTLSVNFRLKNDNDS